MGRPGRERHTKANTRSQEGKARRGRELESGVLSNLQEGTCLGSVVFVRSGCIGRAKVGSNPWEERGQVTRCFGEDAFAEEAAVDAIG